MMSEGEEVFQMKPLQESLEERQKILDQKGASHEDLMDLYRARKELLKESSRLFCAPTSKILADTSEESKMQSSGMQLMNQSLLRTLQQLSASNVELTKQIDELREEAALTKSTVENKLSELSSAVSQKKDGKSRSTSPRTTPSSRTQRRKARRSSPKSSLQGFEHALNVSANNCSFEDSPSPKARIRHAAKHERLRKKRLEEEEERSCNQTEESGEGPIRKRTILLECTECGEWVKSQTSKGGVALGFCCSNVLVSSLS